HVVDEVDRFVDLVARGDVEQLEAEVVALEVLDVLERSRVEVVDADHAVSALQEEVAEMRAEEARATGHEAGRHLAQCTWGAVSPPDAKPGGLRSCARSPRSRPSG